MQSVSRLPIKFGLNNQRLEVIFYRTRRMELIVQVGCTCGSIIERLRKQLFLEASVDYRVWLDEVVLELASVLPPECSSITLRPAPSVLLVSALEDSNSSSLQFALSHLCWSSSSMEVRADLATGVPRELLAQFRPRKEAVLLASAGSWLNLSLPWLRQGLAPRGAVGVLGVSVLARRMLSSFAKPSYSGWLLKRSNLLTHRRFCIISDRCLIYFKSDAPSTPVKGLIPLDYFGVATFDEFPTRFRLANPISGFGLKPEYDFESDDNNTGWVAAVLAVKSFPSVFGVPWHWNFARVESALDLIADVATNMGALSLPNVFVQDGLPGEMAWLEELLDGPLPLDKVKQVMLGCNPRSVVGLFKRYLNFLPSPLVPPSLSLALRAALRTAGGDGAVAAAVGATLRQHDPEQRPALVASFHRILNRVLSFMHALWSNSKGIESLSDCAVIGSTLCRLAPLINKSLTEPAKGDQPEKSLRWRCTLEVTHLVPRPLDQNLQFFEFPDISAFEDSTLIEDDLDAVPLTKEQDEEMSSLMMVSVKEAKAPVSSVEERLAKLEEQLASEQRARALLESKVVALEHRVAQLQDDVLHLTPQPKSPTSQSLVQIAIGRQRGKSGSGAASDADTPELPPRQPRLTVAGRTTGGNK